MLALLVVCNCTGPFKIYVLFVAALPLFLAHQPAFLGVFWQLGFVLRRRSSCCAGGGIYSSGRRGYAPRWLKHHCYMQRKPLGAGLPSCFVGGRSTCAGIIPMFGLCIPSNRLSGGGRLLIGSF